MLETEPGSALSKASCLPVYYGSDIQNTLFDTNPTINVDFYPPMFLCSLLLCACHLARHSKSGSCLDLMFKHSFKLMFLVLLSLALARQSFSSIWVGQKAWCSLKTFEIKRQIFKKWGGGGEVETGEASWCGQPGIGLGAAGSVLNLCMAGAPMAAPES